jgi:S-DNA-T family DNA segregation ATPase FtsK/SpoIIIE
VDDADRHRARPASLGRVHHDRPSTGHASPRQSLLPQQSGPSLHLDLVVRGTAPRSDVTVSITAPRGTRLDDVWPLLLDASASSPGTVHVHGERVSADAVLGLPPLVHGAVLVIGADAPSVATSRRGDSIADPVVEVRICSGPDAGAVHALPPGSYRVGRDGGDVVINDAEVSRAHALIHVHGQSAHAVTVEDVGSTNGLAIGHRLLDADEGGPVRPDDVVRLGRSTLRVGPVQREPVVRRCDGSGLVQVNRPPRSRLPAPHTVVTMPSPPTGRSPSRPPMAALAVPLMVGIALAVVTGTAAYLLFVLLSPLMLLSSWLGDRIASGRQHRSDQAAYERDLAAAEMEVAAALSRERCCRHETFPDPSELLSSARGQRQGLWRRQSSDEEFLALRIGLGTADARLAVRTGSVEDTGTERLQDVPVTVSLVAAGVLGVAGPAPLLDRLVRALVAQLAGWHSPRDVNIVVLAPGPEWQWTRWLPHVLRRRGAAPSDVRVALRHDEVPAMIDELVAGLAARDGPSTAGPRHTVVLAVGGSTLRAAAGGARLLAEGPAAGICVICCEETVSALPIECGATVEVVDATSALVAVHDGEGAATHDVVLDGVSMSWAEDFARTVAPLRDSAPAGRYDGLPRDVRLLDLLEVDAREPTALAVTWSVRPRCTRVPIGIGPSGEPVVVDLAQDGPHVLVAGTTGSGKSELLRTLVASLAALNRPDELVVVLVDYKGGAAFRECALLPHSVGMVTDLDGHLTERALRSLDAELRRRERLLHDAGVPDISAYVRQARLHPASGGGPLPRLVIVVDEFATLADELPDFVHGLVGIAQRGRSLGVHLVLATQRPAGVVSADIRANTSLRIALRVADPAESIDVLDSSDAAGLPRATPGRAAMRLGGDPVRVVQVARVGGPVKDSRRIVVRRHPDAAGDGRRPVDADTVPGSPQEDSDSDLARLVSAVRVAAATVGVVPVPSPWLPPLPAAVGVDDLPTVDAGSPTGTGVPIGLQDLPGEQRRRELTYALDGGDHLLVVGSPGSGRTTTLRTVAGQLARRHTCAELHIHAIDPGGGLSWLSGLPQCGTIVGRHDPERAARLLQLLAAELDRRQRLLAHGGCGSLEEHRDRHPDSGLPFVVLLVDGWQPVRDLLEQVDEGQPVQLFERVLREGSAAGVRVVMTGDRDALSARACAGIADRVLLRLSDPADYALAGVSRSQVPSAAVAGRALVGRQCVETQIGVFGESGSGAGQRAALERITATARDREPHDGHGRSSPLRVEPLPRSVDLSQLLARVGGAAPARDSDGWTLVGVGGDTGRPVGLDLCPDNNAALVAGPPGSGRSNTLVVLARWCQRNGRPVLLVADPHSPLHRLAGEPGLVHVRGFDSIEPLAAALANRPGAVVLVDDAERAQGSAVEPALLSVLRRDGPTAGMSLVLAGTTTDLAAAFHGVVAEVRRGRTGLLFGPHSPVDGDLLGARVPRVRETVPGRGLLVQRGVTTPVQVADAGLVPHPLSRVDPILLGGQAAV